MEVDGGRGGPAGAGAEWLDGDRSGLRIRGWEIEARKRRIPNSPSPQRWEKRLGTDHLPEMVFGDTFLTLKHSNSGATIHFDAFDALSGWKQEGLPPVEVPAAAQWNFRRKELFPGGGKLFWEDCEEKIDLAALAEIEPILFYDEIVQYENELACNGVSLLTAKVLRVVGVLIKLRDPSMHCRFEDTNTPSVLKKSTREKPRSKHCLLPNFSVLIWQQEHPTDSASYNDPSIISQRLPVVMHKTQKLVMPRDLNTCVYYFYKVYLSKGYWSKVRLILQQDGCPSNSRCHTGFTETCYHDSSSIFARFVNNRMWPHTERTYHRSIDHHRHDPLGLGSHVERKPVQSISAPVPELSRRTLPQVKVRYGWSHHSSSFNRMSDRQAFTRPTVIASMQDSGASGAAESSPSFFPIAL